MTETNLPVVTRPDPSVELPPPPQWVHTLPWASDVEARLKHFQKYVRNFIMTRPGAAVWMRMASGKTLVTLSALSLLREPGHILVVAPRNIAIDTWPQEVFDWGFPLRVTSLNITPPGWLNKRGKPLPRQRNLEVSEFNRLIDDIHVSPSGLYTIGTDRFVTLVSRLSTAGPPRTRPAGTAHPHGEFDLDSARDLFWPLIESFELDNTRAKRAKQTPPWEVAAIDLLRKTQITALKPATKSGKPPTVVFALADPDKAKALRSNPIGQEVAQRLATLAKMDLRVAVQIAPVDHTNWPFGTIIIDEAQGFKNKSSNRWIAMRKVAPLANRIIQLSGTPAPEGLHELWAQINLLPGGAQVLGDSYDQHLLDYFKVDQMIDGRPVSWKIDEPSRQRLYRNIEHLAVSAENTELKLPGFEPTRYHTVPLDPDVAQGYRNFKKDTLLNIVTKSFLEYRAEQYALQLSKGATEEQAQACIETLELSANMVHSIEAVNGGVLRGKLLQYAAGSVYLDIGKDHPDYAGATEKTKRPIARIHNGKLDKFAELILEHQRDPDPGKGSILVAYRFDFERALLLSKLTELGITGAMAYNGMPDTKAAWNRREIPVLLIHPASAGHGLNLQRGGHRLIWVSLPESNEHFQQTPARLNRVGQDRPVRVDVILTQGTLDEKMPAALDVKEVSQQKLFDATKAEFANTPISVTDLNLTSPEAK